MNSRIWVVAALVLCLAACAKQNPTAPAVAAPPAPAATTPAGAVQRLAWALMNRESSVYMALLTDDFAFQFDPNDSSGNAYRGIGWDRTLEGAAMEHLLAGGGALPPASGLQLVTSHLLVASGDPRFPMDSLWHASVEMPFDLHFTIDQSGSQTAVTVGGYARFQVVRGDSAYFLPARAAERDSTRWFISRWEDQTLPTDSAPGMHVDPAQVTTMGNVKARYAVAAVASR